MLFNQILCVLNATHHANNALSHAIHLAEKNQAKLTILLALESLPPTANMVMESASYIESSQTIENRAKQWLEKKVAKWNKQYPLTASVTIGNPLEHIERVSKEVNADLVVRHAEDSFIDALVGTDDIHLIHQSPCPVLVTHHKLPKTYKNIIVALDANYHYIEEEKAEREKLNQSLVNLASQLAKQESANVTIVSVYDVFPSALLGDGFISVPIETMEDEAKAVEQEQDNVIRSLIDNAPESFSPHVQIERGNARVVLPNIAKHAQADLVIMGTLARVGIPGLLIGNTVAAVISQLECAVLALKPKSA